jgi:hypothetical protein
MRNRPRGLLTGLFCLLIGDATAGVAWDDRGQENSDSMAAELISQTSFLESSMTLGFCARIVRAAARIRDRTQPDRQGTDPEGSDSKAQIQLIGDIAAMVEVALGSEQQKTAPELFLAGRFMFGCGD